MPVDDEEAVSVLSDTHRDDVTLPALVVALVAGAGYVALIGALFLSWAVRP